jgi:uncharacterized protein with GYD domain
MRPARTPIGLQLAQAARVLSRALDEELAAAGGRLDRGRLCAARLLAVSLELWRDVQSGGVMCRFMIEARYSPGAWARLLKVTDDRTQAARGLMESLGGSLERMDWNVETGTAFAVAELPDTVCAAAMITALTKTGSFTGVEVKELLNQEQMQEALVIAREVSKAYSPPGSAAFDRET